MTEPRTENLIEGSCEPGMSKKEPPHAQVSDRSLGVDGSGIDLSRRIKIQELENTYQLLPGIGFKVLESNKEKLFA